MMRRSSYTPRMPPTESDRRPAGNPRRGLLVLGLILAAAVPSAATAFQDGNPYGEIDPITTSISVLQRSLNGPNSVSTLADLDRFDPDGITELFERTLDHPGPAMRMIAGVALVERGSPPAAIAGRMGSPEATGALVIGALAAGRLDRDDAVELARSDLSIPPVAKAITLALAGRETDLDGLSTILEDRDSPPLACGIAAAALERTRPGTIQGWLESAAADDRLDRSRLDRVIFETIEASRPLGLASGISAIEIASRDRPANDGLRAAAVLTLLEIAPETGIVAWEALAASATESISRIPICMLLVGTETAAPAGAGDMIPNADPLQRDLRELVLASPEERPRVADAAVNRGHLPTIRWFLELPDDQMSVDTLDSILEQGVKNRRPAMVEALIDAAAAMARLAPEQLLARLEAAQSRRDTAVSEILLRGLVDAGSEPAAEVARALLDAPRRGTRSMALLAVANGSSLDETLVGRIGRIAAGGGDLPQDLRPLAAWYHLRMSDSLDESLPKILAP